MLNTKAPSKAAQRIARREAGIAHAVRTASVPAAGTPPAISWLTRGSVLTGIQNLVAKTNPDKNRTALQGNYAPIPDQLFVKDMQVEGEIPKELRGVFMRNGPNPAFPVENSYHWFEGDGMVHATRLRPVGEEDCKVSYCNRYVETSKLAQERTAGQAIFAKFGDQEGMRGVVVAMLEMAKVNLGVLDNSRGNGTGNTALVAHAGRIMALHEGDLPYQLRVMCDGLLETVGRLKLEGWGEQPFTAHPKLDASTGILHFMGYQIDKKPYLQYSQMDSQGRMARSVLQIETPYPVMMHDMAITDRYVVFPHLPLCFDPEAMVKDNTLPIVYKPERPARFGILPKDASAKASDIRWIEMPSFMSFHVANAWEEEDGNVIKVHLCCTETFDMGTRSFDAEKFGSRMAEVTIDLRTGTATRRYESDVRGDFPVVHPAMQGKPTRFAWVGSYDPQDVTAKMDGIAKIDLMAARQQPAGSSQAFDATVGHIKYPQGVYGGEAFYVPRNSSGGDEDDGFLVVYTYDEAANCSYFNVFDARTMDSKPLARVRLPQRVPFGFHGTWVPEEKLREQVPAAASM